MASTPPQLPTPDFYDYAWLPAASVHVVGRFVRVAWSDGTTLDAFDWWLRENAVDAGGVDLATREHLLDPANVAEELRIGSAELTVDGALAVTFEPDGAKAQFHPGWLRHVADGNHRAQSWLPTATSWMPTTFSEPPTFDLSLIHI